MFSDAPPFGACDQSSGPACARRQGADQKADHLEGHVRPGVADTR